MDLAGSLLAPFPEAEATTVTPIAVPVPLSALPDQKVGVVVDVGGNSEDASRLKSLGVCVGRRVQMLKAGNPLIVRVLGARVGLSARIAASVLVGQSC